MARNSPAPWEAITIEFVLPLVLAVAMWRLGIWVWMRATHRSIASFSPLAFSSLLALPTLHLYFVISGGWPFRLTPEGVLWFPFFLLVLDWPLVVIPAATLVCIRRADCKTQQFTTVFVFPLTLATQVAYLIAFFSGDISSL